MTINTYEKTAEKITYTFGGWDGKSYNGETKTSNVYTHVAQPGKKFIRLYQPKYRGREPYSYHIVLEDVLHPITQVPTVRYWNSCDN